MSQGPTDADRSVPPGGAAGTPGGSGPHELSPYEPPSLDAPVQAPPVAPPQPLPAAAQPPSAGAAPAAAAADPASRPPGPGWTQVQPKPPAESGPPSRNWVVAALARGIALFIGCFTLVSTVGVVRDAAFDANAWWVVVPYVPRLASAALLAAAGVAFVAYGVAPRLRAWRRWLTLALFAFFAAVAVYDAYDFYRVWSAGEIRPGVPLPLSAVVAVLLGFLIWAAFRDPPRSRWPAIVVVVAGVAVCAFVFPLAQVFFFGMTDYRRPADVAVVFGAQVHNDGRPSTSLRDRMDTAVELYKSGLVKRIIVSGGVGESGYNEALVMRDMAKQAGVPAGKVVVDSNGVSTAATVADTVPFFGGKDWQRILAVSQFYHLPRIKLAYQRAGWDVLTVPAGTSTPIPQTPALALREVPAFWVYYLRAIFG